MGEMKPGVLRGILTRVAGSGIARSDEALTAIALDIERRYKVHLADGGAHPRGTQTTATPGRGPAIVTGDLRRSATHTKTVTPEGLEFRIGPASTPHSGGHATSGQIGLCLETGLRNGAMYPALKPAFEEGIALNRQTFRTVFTGRWSAGV